jgi:hypothetical protein
LNRGVNIGPAADAGFGAHRRREGGTLEDAKSGARPGDPTDGAAKGAGIRGDPETGPEASQKVSSRGNLETDPRLSRKERIRGNPETHRRQAGRSRQRGNPEPQSEAELEKRGDGET